MKVTGKNLKMFIGDKEIESISSFSFNVPFNRFLSDVDFPGKSSGVRETVTFEGSYDPPDRESWEDILSKLCKIGDKLLTIITSPSGEKMEALMQIKYEDGKITLEPVERYVKQWIEKEWGRML